MKSLGLKVNLLAPFTSRVGGSYDSYTHWPPDCDLVKSLGQMRHHVLLGFKSLHELPVGSTSSLVHIQGKWLGNV